MKKVFSLFLICSFAMMAFGQNYDQIKTMVTLGQYAKAKEDLDKKMGDAKFTSKAEAYLLKTAIYSGIAMNSLNISIGMSKEEVVNRLGKPQNTTNTTTSEGTTEMLFYEGYTINFDTKGRVDWIRQSGNTSGVKGTNEMVNKMVEYLNEAETAFKKYKEMDPSTALISDQIYQNGPINLYSGFYSLGYRDYISKSWAAGFDKLKKAVELSDLLISKKIIAAPLDTNVLILAGITAENNKSNDDAARYYSRLADAKIPGDDYEAVYRFLVNYYFNKKDIPAFEKYKAIGKELYPKSEYFTYDKVDFAAGLMDNFNDKVKAVEEVLAADPNDYKANQVLGEIIYDTLNSTREGAVLPSNAAELEVKMVNAFKKAASLKPGSELPFLFMGDHFISKAVKVNEARSTHASEMKARTKPGTMASKEDVAKRDLLDKQYGEALEAAREPYEKSAEIFSTKKEMQLRDKQQYKKACNYLADIYAFKKAQAKGKPADQAKYAAEEKKWNDRYDTIK